MERKLIASLLCALLSFPCLAQATREETPKHGVVASTTWSAAFADLGGADNVVSIAPASLQHPPEYEITVSDMQTIQNCSIFIYAGFERMMKSLGDSVGDVTMVQIQCDNSIATVKAMAEKIAKVAGTEERSEARVQEYIDTIKQGAAQVEMAGLKGAKALVNKNQTYLAKELGLEVAGTFGPGEVTSSQIADAKKGGYALIIDNVHNPVGTPLKEVAPDARYVVWRNFPERTGRGALKEVVERNISSLCDAGTPHV